MSWGKICNDDSHVCSLLCHSKAIVNYAQLHIDILYNFILILSTIAQWYFNRNYYGLFYEKIALPKIVPWKIKVFPSLQHLLESKKLPRNRRSKLQLPVDKITTMHITTNVGQNNYHAYHYKRWTSRHHHEHWHRLQFRSSLMESDVTFLDSENHS